MKVRLLAGFDRSLINFREPRIAPLVAAAGEVVAAAPAENSEVPARVSALGAPDSNPTGIAREQVEAWQADGFLSDGGHVTDVRPELAACSVYVLPSDHEGIPRSVLEGMAAGRTTITTDTVGCRETVRLPAGATRDDDAILTGENGLLAPVRDARAQARAMERRAHDPKLVRRMGARSRALAEAEFDVRRLNAQMLDALGISVRGGLL